MKTRSGSPVGFTLVELCVTIAIIAVLITILIAAGVAVRDSSRRTVCMSNLRQIGLLIHTYATDSNGEIPAVYSQPTTPQGDPKAASEIPHPTAWFRPLLYRDNGGLMVLVDAPIGTGTAHYAKSGTPFLCPGDSTAVQDSTNDFPFDRVGRASWVSPGLRTMSYVYAYVPKGGNYYAPSTTGGHWEDGAFSTMQRHNVNQTNAQSTAIMYEMALVMLPHRPLQKRCHGLDGNVLYLDGHVKDVSKEEVKQKFDVSTSDTVSSFVGILDSES